MAYHVHAGVYWCSTGWFQSSKFFLAFVPSEEVWRKLMQKRNPALIKCYPPTHVGAAANVTDFEDKSDNSTCVVMTMNENVDKECNAIEIMALIAHEALHVMQYLHNHIGEDPTKLGEYHCYSLQAICNELGHAYRDARKIKALGYVDRSSSS